MKKTQKTKSKKTRKPTKQEILNYYLQHDSSFALQMIKMGF